MKKKFSLILVLVLMLSCVTACGKTEEPSSDQGAEKAAFTGTYLVDASYVVDNLDNENTVLLDCRGAKAANKKTVKGAVATTWQEMCTCSEEYGSSGDENWGKIPEAADLAKRCGALGLAKDKEIICLGETTTGWGDDARLAWELIAAGYENVKIVDGGINAVFDAGVETQNGGSAPKPCKVSIDAIDKTHVMETEKLQKNYDDYVIVDVREDKEYDGATLYGEAKGGHLPGAIHIKYMDLFNEDGTLRPAEEIEALYTEAGISKTDKIVTYCTGGIRSAYVQMVLEMMGYENTWNYDQSYYRWCVVGDVE